MRPISNTRNHIQRQRLTNSDSAREKDTTCNKDGIPQQEMTLETQETTLSTSPKGRHVDNRNDSRMTLNQETTLETQETTLSTSSKRQITNLENKRNFDRSSTPKRSSPTKRLRYKKSTDSDIDSKSKISNISSSSLTSQNVNGMWSQSPWVIVNDNDMTWERHWPWRPLTFKRKKWDTKNS